MIRRFQIFLGPARLRWLFFLLAITGFGNLILNAFVEQVSWARAAQSLLVAIFITGIVILVGGRLDPYDRGRWAALLLPAFGAVFLGMALAPGYLLLFMGLAFGWLVAGLFLFKPRGPMQYQIAVKHLRRSEYDEAVKAMDTLIKDEPQNPNHYRFRAEILRLWGKLDRARRDYEKMAQIDPESAVAFNGLAEVYLQQRQYEAARKAGEKALALAPGEWVAAYNLGMIEDRLSESEGAVTHLQLALAHKVPDIRHRLLIHLYLARAYSRLGDFNAAQAQVELLRKNRGGLQEWQLILDNPQAETLRAVLADDVATARKLEAAELDVRALQNGTSG